MKDAVLAGACTAFLSASLTGCGGASRYRLLSTFFDGVPTPRPAAVDAGAGAVPAEEASTLPVVRPHEPYAKKQCNACHDSAAGNGLLEINGRLCLRCHKLKLEKKFVHGPLASGGCLICHDPHSSQYPKLLVSESETFCVDCHDRASVEKLDAHRGTERQCTTCHDAHMSDKEYLLR